MMPTLFIEPRDGWYVILKNGRTVNGRSATQAGAIAKAHAYDPTTDVKAARVKTTDEGKPDQWREV